MFLVSYSFVHLTFLIVHTAYSIESYDSYEQWMWKDLKGSRVLYCSLMFVQFAAVTDKNLALCRHHRRELDKVIRKRISNHRSGTIFVDWVKMDVHLCKYKTLHTCNDWIYRCATVVKLTYIVQWQYFIFMLSI